MPQQNRIVSTQTEPCFFTLSPPVTLVRSYALRCHPAAPRALTRTARPPHSWNVGTPMAPLSAANSRTPSSLPQAATPNPPAAAAVFPLFDRTPAGPAAFPIFAAGFQPPPGASAPASGVKAGGGAGKGAKDSFRRPGSSFRSRANQPCPSNTAKICTFGRTSFVVDEFRFAPPAGVTIYFLSHFHADHYGGLSKKWITSHPQVAIYTGPVTARLVCARLGVPPNRVYYDLSIYICRPACLCTCCVLPPLLPTASLWCLWCLNFC